MTQLDQAATASSAPTRRRVLVAGGVVAAAAAVTAGCSSSSTPPAGTPVSGGSAGGSGSSVSTTDIPVGGGVVLQDKQVVITQPTAGTYKAFSAVCTHEGCIVAQVAEGTITCPCHMGQFSAADGSVQGGPPPAPLAEVAITVSGTTITLA